MPFCPECGAEVDAQDVHCYNCGRNLDGGHAGPQQDQRHESDDQWGSAWDEGTESQQPTQGPAGGQETREVDETAKGTDRYIEDGKVEYTIYFPITRGYKALGLGGLFVFLSFLIVPAFTVFGYVYRLTEAAARGDTVQPPFDELGAMTKQGFFYFLLYLLFAIISAIVVALPIGIGVEAGVPALIVVSIVAALAIGYVAPAVFVLYPVTGSISKAFSPGRIKEFAFTSKYLISYLILIALLFAFNLALQFAILILAITIIGIFLLIPVIPIIYALYFYVVGVYWGATYYEAAQEGLVPHVSEQDDPTQDDPYTQTSADTGWD